MKAEQNHFSDKENRPAPSGAGRGRFHPAIHALTSADSIDKRLETLHRQDFLPLPVASEVDAPLGGLPPVRSWMLTAWNALDGWQALRESGYPARVTVAALDLSGFTGYFARHWSLLLGQSVVMAEPNGAALRWLQDYFPESVSIPMQPAVPLPFPAGSFAVVSAHLLFNRHPPGHLDFWVLEICRLLREDGLAVITMLDAPAQGEEDARGRALQSWLDSGFGGQPAPTVAHPPPATNMHFPGLQTVRRRLQRIADIQVETLRKGLWSWVIRPIRRPA
jgi:SAM-dependent methyltransferase